MEPIPLPIRNTMARAIDFVPIVSHTDLLPPIGRMG
jgi:hypothetical protein